MKDFIENVQREVSDCDGRFYKKPTKIVTHKYSECAAILVRFKYAGESSYANQLIGFCYTDEDTQKYLKIDDLFLELNELRLILLGINLQDANPSTRRDLFN